MNRKELQQQRRSLSLRGNLLRCAMQRVEAQLRVAIRELELITSEQRAQLELVQNLSIVLLDAQGCSVQSTHQLSNRFKTVELASRHQSRRIPELVSLNERTEQKAWEIHSRKRRYRSLEGQNRTLARQASLLIKRRSAALTLAVLDDWRYRSQWK